MYSPKIREDFIPKLYQIAQQRRIPMTQLVDDFIAEGLRRVEASTLLERRLERFEAPRL